MSSGASLARAGRRPGLVRDALGAGVGGQQRKRDERNENGADDRGGMLAQQPEQDTEYTGRPEKCERDEEQ